jgi:hypothetical protein
MVTPKKNRAREKQNGISLVLGVEAARARTDRQGVRARVQRTLMSDRGRILGGERKLGRRITMNGSPRFARLPSIAQQRSAHVCSCLQTAMECRFDWKDRVH